MKIFLCLALLASLSFAESSETLPLPLQLQVEELPWFAMVAKDGEESYNGVLNKDRLKSIIAQNNSKQVVFAFFATWCIACRESLATMSKKAAELKSDGVLVVLINVGEEDYGKVSRWVKEYAKEEWLLGFDKFSNLPENFGLAKRGEEMLLPRTLLLDSNLRPLTLLGAPSPLSLKKR
ncbi:MAG: TlpA family protein disulfide reductase [Fibromonadaceae bacterium]|jgi:thiol-disulfide isomerase/thioredoxin|nr:TlpA family protein disulfide reductase [Fibromonadaceae bacterium]